MKIVIDIPEEDYKHILHRQREYCITTSKLEDVIAKGTPLPKGHGRLIDADELLTSERPKCIADDVWKESHIYKLLSNAPTIVEADKAESEECR